MAICFAVALAEQYEQQETYYQQALPQISHDDWASLNPYGKGPEVPAEIQSQWNSFMVNYNLI